MFRQRVEIRERLIEIIAKLKQKKATTQKKLDCPEIGLPPRFEQSDASSAGAKCYLCGDQRKILRIRRTAKRGSGKTFFKTSTTIFSSNFTL
jgi:hypothetical protein